MASTIVIDSFLHPVLQIKQISIDPITPLSGAPHAPADVSHQVPLVVFHAHERAAAVSLASIDSPVGEACASHPPRDGVAQVGVSVRASLARNQRHLGLLEQLKQDNVKF